MMVGISTITANVDGDIVIDAKDDSEIYNLVPRVSRVSTLDGGVVLTHSGFAHGDRTLRINAENMSESDCSKLRTLVENETLMHFSIEDGFFSGMVESMRIDNGKLSMTVLLKEKLSA